MHLTGSSRKRRRSDATRNDAAGSIADTHSSGDLQKLTRLMQFPRVDVSLGGVEVKMAE
jgi:hypothetical protein